MAVVWGCVSYISRGVWRKFGVRVFEFLSNISSPQREYIYMEFAFVCLVNYLCAMNFYIREAGNRPIDVAREISRLDGDMVEVRGKDGRRLRRTALEVHPDKVQLVQQLHSWYQSMGRNFYDPNPKGRRFHLSLAQSKVAFGGNRSGKSATCTLDVIMQCEGWHPLQRMNLEELRENALDDWVRDHCEYVLDNGLWIPDPPIMARCVAVDFPNGVEKICGPEYIKWASKGEVEYNGYANEKKRRIVWKNGSELEFMSTDQDLDTHGGTARHVIHVDEECPPEYWQENMMRTISVGGRMILGMTAVNGITWVKHKLWDRFIEEIGEKRIDATFEQNL